VSNNQRLFSRKFSADKSPEAQCLLLNTPASENVLLTTELGEPLDSSQLTILQSIEQSGHFSKAVYIARYTRPNNSTALFAVKESRNDKEVRRVREELMDEARLSRYVSCAQHPHILHFVGWYEADSLDDIRIVTELMGGGDLMRFLQDNAATMSVERALDFCMQICEGMRFLTKIHVVHRDLSAKNCLWVGFNCF